MTDFLPTDYKVPSSSDKYMKFVKGDNRFRILTSPILGYEIWKDDGDKRVPIRTRMSVPFTTEQAPDPEDIKHFWAMVVYNYANKTVQILEITQKGIQKTLKALAQDEDWGSPVQKYDIVVTKAGDGMETKYEVLPKPATKMDDGIIELFNTMKINLNALYDGKDPYAEVTEEVNNDEISTGMDKLKAATKKAVGV